MTTTRFTDRNSVLSFYALAFGISWGGMLLVAGGPAGIPGSSEQVERLMPLALLALFAGPSVAAVVTTGIVSGRAGLRELLVRLVRWRVGGRWYAVAFLTGPVLVTAALLGLSLSSREFIPGVVTAEDRVFLILFGLGWGLIGGGFLEELGWTGVAVARLRRRHTALAAALIVGLLHGTWHLPIACWAGGRFSGGRWPPYLVGILVFYLGALPAYRMLMVWVYDRTESLLVAMFMHAMLSASTLVLQPPLAGTSFVVWNMALAAVLWAVVGAAAVSHAWPVSRSRLGKQTA